MSTATFNLYGEQWLDSSAPPAALATENSGAGAPSGGVVVRRRFRGFDASSAEFIILRFKLPSNYASGGTLSFEWSANATSGNVIWWTSWARTTPGVDDFDGAQFATLAAQSASAAPGTAGVEKSVSYDLGMTSFSAGDVLYVMLGRSAADVSDTMTGDAELCEPVRLTVNTI